MLVGQAEVIGATSLASARDKLGKEKFDVVMLDINLPDGAGLDLVPFVRTLAKPSMPVILYTAQKPDMKIVSSVDGVLIKSLNSNQQIKAIVKALVNSEG